MMAGLVRINRVQVDEIARNWGWITQLLAPAVAHDPNRTLTQVKQAALISAMGIATLHGPSGAGIVVIEPGWFDGKWCLWLPYMAGRLKAGPKTWMLIARDIMEQFEALARDSGCEEIRIGGRNYAGIFPGFERFDAQNNRLRKVL